MTQDLTSTAGGSATFVDRLTAEAVESSAVEHPYLQSLVDGSLPQMNAALKDFAFQYGLYSRHFIKYVAAVSEQLADEQHRQILKNNIAEEQGDTHDVELPDDVLAEIDGLSHRALYARFTNALGMHQSFDQATDECPGRIWSEQFLNLCGDKPNVGIGAIGIGTEFIVSRVFTKILDSLKSHSRLSVSQRVFFELHSVCDDHHADELLTITRALAIDKVAREEIAHGVRTAIKLRSRFWDQLLLRATQLPDLQAHSDEELSVGGH